MFNTSEKNAYTKNLDMEKHWFTLMSLQGIGILEDGENSLSLKKPLNLQPESLFGKTPVLSRWVSARTLHAILSGLEPILQD